MTAAVTNPFSLTWGTFEVGGTTEKLITGIHRITRDFRTWQVTLDVLIRATSDATLATNCAEIESEFSKRRQAIVFKVGSSTIHTFNPAGTANTGLNSWATCQKNGTPGADTDRSRLYTVSVGCELPATDTSGRRDSRLVVDYDPAQRRTVTITGEWTAVTTNDATAQYAAQIATFCSSALGALLPAGTFELVAQKTDRDDQDKVLTFTRTYREMFVAQPGGSLDNAQIVEPTIGFTRDIPAPGDSGAGSVKRLETITCRFDCYLDKTASTDVPALYTNTVRPYILTQFTTLFSPIQWGIIAEQRTHEPYSNRLSVMITFQAAINTTNVVEIAATSRIVEDAGVVMTGIWNGGIFAKYADQGIGTRRRFGIVVSRVLGTSKPNQRVGGGGGTVFGVGFRNPDGTQAGGTYRPGEQVSQGADRGWILVANDSSATPKWIGQAGGDQLLVTDYVEQTIEEYVDDPGGARGWSGLTPGPGGSWAGA